MRLIIAMYSCDGAISFLVEASCFLQKSVWNRSHSTRLFYDKPASILVTKLFLTATLQPQWKGTSSLKSLYGPQLASTSCLIMSGRFAKEANHYTIHPKWSVWTGSQGHTAVEIWIWGTLSRVCRHLHIASPMKHCIRNLYIFTVKLDNICNSAGPLSDFPHYPSLLRMDNGAGNGNRFMICSSAFG